MSSKKAVKAAGVETISTPAPSPIRWETRTHSGTQADYLLVDCVCGQVNTQVAVIGEKVHMRRPWLCQFCGAPLPADEGVDDAIQEAVRGTE